MREQRVFGDRTRLSSKDRTKRKYFFVYEGKTEEIYFKAIIEKKEEIGINSIFEMVPIVRSFSEEGESNPQRILDRVLSYIEENRTGNITYKTFFDEMLEYLFEKDKRKLSSISKRTVFKYLKEICMQKLEKKYTDIIDKNKIKKEGELVIRELEEKLSIDNLSNDIYEIIKQGEKTYAEDIDKICLIVDRDKDSFVENQYKNVIERCKNNKISLYVTNPCFEFWLIMHFDDLDAIDKEMLRNNERYTERRRYAEHILNTKMRSKYNLSFRKSKYNTDIFIENIDRAILNEKKFCEDIKGLMNEIGSNIGKLIIELKDKK